jgi:hypothetical protein
MAKNLWIIAKSWLLLAYPLISACLDHCDMCDDGATCTTCTAGYTGATCDSCDTGFYDSDSSANTLTCEGKLLNQPVKFTAI